MRLVSSTRATAKRVHHLADVENWHLLASMQDVMYLFNPLETFRLSRQMERILLCVALSMSVYVECGNFKERLYRCTTPYIQTKYQKRKSASTIA